MPPTAAAAKKGLRDYLRTTAGLTAADKVTVRSAMIEPAEFAQDMVVLGDVTAPQTQAGLERREETPTVQCWVIVTRPGGDETAVDAARDRADALMALVVGALVADRSAGGAVPPPARLDLSTSGLQESPVDWQGAAARRAEIPFMLSWTSHIT